MSTSDSYRPPTKDAANSPAPFVFVPVSGHEASQGRGPANYLVRAHIARWRHAMTPPSSQRLDFNGWEAPTAENNAEEDAADNTPQAKERPNTSKKRQKARHIFRDDRVRAVDKHRSAVISPDIPRIPAAKRAGAERQDPFWSYPVDYEPYLPAIFAHYVENVAVEMAELDFDNQKGLLRRRWFPLAMEAPSTMYAVLLMAASHYCAVSPPQKASQIDLLCLKSRALQEINKAMRHADPRHALSDTVIGAVMKMAACEAVFGDPAVYKAHMNGLSLMVSKRGGLGNLGLNGFLERLMVWIDLNAAFLHKYRRTFGNDSFPTSVEIQDPNPYHFTGMK